jgi:hypothetical protein
MVGDHREAVTGDAGAQGGGECGGIVLVEAKRDRFDGVGGHRRNIHAATVEINGPTGLWLAIGFHCAMRKEEPWLRNFATTLMPASMASSSMA